MTDEKKKTASKKQEPEEEVKSKDRDLMTAMVMFGFYPIHIVNTSKPGESVIMEWTFPQEAADFKLQWERQGKRSIKLDGKTYADIVEAQDVFRNCLHSVSNKD